MNYIESSSGRTEPGESKVADHGLIGDLRTAALVSTKGTVDWLCVPRFDAPSVFCALLDSERGGAWRLAPTCEVSTTQQFYFPDSNVLITRFLTEDGVAEVRDFMPVDSGDDCPGQGVVRIVKAVRGEVELRSEVQARFDYGQRAATTTAQDDGSVLLCDSDVGLRLRASVPLTIGGGEVRASFSLGEGHIAAFALDLQASEDDQGTLSIEEAEWLFDITVAFWRQWLAQGTYRGRWREMVERSALALKLLTHRSSGAIIAAPTASLPEHVGGERNWDYRFVWSRETLSRTLVG